MKEKPKLSVRKNEGTDSLIRRGRAKLSGETLIEFNRCLMMFDDSMRVLEDFFELEHK